MERRQQIAILNRSTVAMDEEVQAITTALQRQVDEDFSPAWGVGAELQFLGRDEQSGWQGRWNLLVLDTSDEANALGYHDLTPEGFPVAKCFAKAKADRLPSAQLRGAQLSVTMSHELLEMLGDPGINLMVPNDSGRIYAYENCDPVGTDELGYEIDGVRVSDFVYPDWFVPSFRGLAGKRFDHAGHVSEPFQLAPGGHIYATEVWPPTWQQIEAERTGAADPQRGDPLKRAPVGSRRERRSTDRSRWARSRN